MDEGAYLGVLEVDFGQAILVNQVSRLRVSTCKAVSRVLPVTRTPGPSAFTASRTRPRKSRLVIYTRRATSYKLMAPQRRRRLHPLRHHVEPSTSASPSLIKSRMAWATFSRQARSKSSRRTTNRVCSTVSMSK